MSERTIGPAVIRYRCRCPGTRPMQGDCGGPCGDHSPGLRYVGCSSFLPEPDGRTHAMRCARCNRWNLYRAAESKAA